MRIITCAFASVALLAAAPPSPRAKAPTPADILAKSPAAAWHPVPPENLLVLDFKSGARVVIMLAPEFAPVHVANIRALARAGWWDGSAIYRVQDNYVAQWGHNDDRPLPPGIVAKPPAEYQRPLAGLHIRPFPYRDVFAVRAGHAAGWPVAIADGQATLTHCYGTVGVGRDLAPDTGTGGELYAIIGGPARALDRNIAIVGRVIAGIETMSALPRGTEALGFYKERSSDVPIRSGRLASDMPMIERPSFEILDTASPTFAAWLKARADRRDDFFVHPAGAIDLCNAQVPVRPLKSKA